MKAFSWAEKDSILLSAPNPRRPLVGGIVEVAVVGAAEEFAAAILDGNERLCHTAGTTADPRRTLVGGVIQAFVRAGDDFVPVFEKVAELAASAPAVAGNPGRSTIGGVFDLVVGRVDPDQLVSVSNQLWHGDSYMTKLFIFCIKTSTSTP